MNLRFKSSRVLSLSAVFAAVIFIFAGTAAAAWGDLDASFGTGGLYTDTATGLRPRNMAIQPDGKILVTGYTFTQVNGVNKQRLFLRRYLADGGRDTLFGSSMFPGAPVAIVATADYAGKDITVLENGIIVVLADGNGKLMTWTYHPNGSVKSTRTLTNFPAAEAHIASIGNTAYVSAFRSANNDLYLIRLTSDGAQDMTFNGSGYSLTNIGSSGASNGAHGLVAEADTGRLTVAGLLSNGDLALDRKFADGSNDPTLNSYFPDTTAVNGSSVVDIVRTMNGQYVVGYTHPADFTLIGIYSRFDADGRFISTNGGSFAVLILIGVQQNGYVIAGSNHQFRRHDPDFTTTETFNPIESGTGGTMAAVTPDDKIVFASTTFPSYGLKFSRVLSY